MSDNNRNNILNCNEQKMPTAFVPMPCTPYNRSLTALVFALYSVAASQPAYYDRIRRTQRAPSLFLLFHTKDLFIQLLCNFFFGFPFSGIPICAVTTTRL